MKATLEFTTTTKVEKYTSEEARRGGEAPEVVERTRVQRVTPEQARALGFTEKDIQEALHGA
jgi:hypothetical protein